MSDLKECCEAFEKWYEKQSFVGTPTPFTFEVWQAAWQTRTPPAAPSKEVVDILDQIRKSGFVSYSGEKPHVLAVKALALIKAAQGGKGGG